MDDFREQFLSDSIEKLDNLIADFQTVNSISRSKRSELLRCLHTIKGSAQVFGLKQASVLAHDFENLVLSRRAQNGVDALLQNGLLVLKNSLADPDGRESQKIVSKIDASGREDAFSDKLSAGNYLTVPPILISKLSSQEKIALSHELRIGNTVFCIDIGFKSAAFGSQLTAARRILDDSGTVIAVIPSSDFGLNGLFGFIFLYVSAKQTEEIRVIVDPLGGKITYCSSEFQNSLQGIVSLVVSHGKEIAILQGKSIEFDVLIDEIELPSASLKMLFESLLHLVRNAVDHGFEKSGTLRINVNSVSEGILVTVSDDGKGIDPVNILAIAKEKGLVSNNDNLSDEATLALIFQSEFSTASQLTEISGRGVGLDAVKSSVEKAGGTISVTSKLNEGTAFEIILPNSN